MHEKRMRKMERVREYLPAPRLEGPEDAEVTLVGWGSTSSILEEAAARLTRAGTPTNLLHIKYLYPFHAREVGELLGRAKRSIVVEVSYSGQFARHIRAETGVTVDHVVTRYDGEPLDPAYVVASVRERLAGREPDLRLREGEAREMAYHFIRIHLHDEARPARVAERPGRPYGEPVFEVELVSRKGHEPRGKLVLGRETGALHAYEAHERNDA